MPATLEARIGKKEGRAIADSASVDYMRQTFSNVRRQILVITATTPSSIVVIHVPQHLLLTALESSRSGQPAAQDTKDALSRA